jgi:hypothetical protein
MPRARGRAFPIKKRTSHVVVNLDTDKKSKKAKSQKANSKIIMSHTVHPYSHRLGILRDWKSRWFSTDKKFREFLKAMCCFENILLKNCAVCMSAQLKLNEVKKHMRVIIKPHAQV